MDRSRYSTIIIALSWLLGLMLTPHTLALLGNLAGMHRHALPYMLLLGAAVYLVSANAFRVLWDRGGLLPSQAANRPTTWGNTALLSIPLSGYLITTVVGATGMLVTAGFVFNEVFVYWFPNFAFAFILLGILLAIQFLNRSAIEMVQVGLIGIAVTGLAALVIWGVFGTSAQEVNGPVADFDLQVRPVFMVLLLWIGFDLMYINRSRQAHQANRHFVLALTGLMAMTLLFGLWGAVSLKYTAAHRLADSTIAHTLAAKQILGQPGRILIGLVAIAGACAAVNALFTASSKLVQAYASHGLMPSWRGILASRPSATVVGLSAIVACLMAGGVAGTDAIDTYLRAGLLMWMLHYAVVNFRMLLPPSKGVSATLAAMTGSAVAAALLFSGAVALLLTDPDRISLLRFLAMTYGGLCLISQISVKIHCNHRKIHHPVRNC